MREQGLVACQPRPWRPTTTIAGDTSTTPDMLERDFTCDTPARKLVGDITYIRTWEGWLYLATVLDCHTKQVVGYAMADHLRTSLITDALILASQRIEIRRDVTIFHSDRGCQYLPIHVAGIRGLHQGAWAATFAWADRDLLRQCVGRVIQRDIEE